MRETGDAALRPVIEEAPDPGHPHEHTERNRHGAIRTRQPERSHDDEHADDGVRQARPRVDRLDQPAAAERFTVGVPRGMDCATASVKATRRRGPPTCRRPVRSASPDTPGGREELVDRGE